MRRVFYYKLYHEDMRIPELIKKDSIEIDYNLYNNRKNICSLCKDLLQIHEECDVEYILIPIDLSFNPLGVFILNFFNVRDMNPKEVFTDILLTGAVAFFLVKYTPINTLKIELNDINMCEMLQSLGILFDLEFIDFIVMNESSYLTLKGK